MIEASSITTIAACVTEVSNEGEQEHPSIDISRYTVFVQFTYGTWNDEVVPEFL